MCPPARAGTIMDIGGYPSIQTCRRDFAEDGGHRLECHAWIPLHDHPKEPRSRSDPSTKLSRTAPRRQENQGESTGKKKGTESLYFGPLCLMCSRCRVLMSPCVPMATTHARLLSPPTQDTDPFLFFLFFLSSFLFFSPPLNRIRRSGLQQWGHGCNLP